MKALEIIVSGVVQGVGFRHYTREAALQIGVSGTVKNLPDGTVKILVEGPQATVTQFLDWCHQGPQSATVTQLTYSEIELSGFSNFNIIRL